MLKQKWIRQPNLLKLDLDTRGFLAELLAISLNPEEPIPGLITEFGQPLSLREIGQKLNIDPRVTRRCMKQLRDRNFIRHSIKGYFLPTVIRLENERLKKVRAGRMGGNPQLKKTTLPAKTVPQPSATQPLSPAMVETKRFHQFWRKYPKPTRQHATRAQFHTLSVNTPNFDDVFLMLMDHLKNRIDPVVGDPRWLDEPGTIPEPLVFLKKRLWEKPYRTLLETLK